MNAIRLADYVLAIRNGRAANLRGTAASCPHCYGAPPQGLLISERGQHGCLGCANLERTCTECHLTKPIHEFDVSQRKGKPARVEHRCSECRRARGRAQYYTAQQSQREIVSYQVCIECGEDKPAKAFHRDHRYSGGLEHICKFCKKEKWLDYIQTPSGRAAFEAAQARYRGR